MPLDLFKDESLDLYAKDKGPLDLFKEEPESHWEGWVKPSLKEFGKGVAAVPETTATLGTGLAAFPLSGWAGITELFKTGDLKKASEAVEKTAEMFTYRPKGLLPENYGLGELETAEKATGLAVKPIEWMQKVRDKVGGFVFEKTGDPDLAASVATMFEFGSYTFAGKVGTKLKPKTIPELKPWDVGISPEAFVEMQRNKILSNIKDMREAPHPKLAYLRRAEPIKSAAEAAKVLEAEILASEKPAARAKLIEKLTKEERVVPFKKPILIEGKPIPTEERLIVEPAGPDFLERAAERVGGKLERPRADIVIKETAPEIEYKGKRFKEGKPTVEEFKEIMKEELPKPKAPLEPIVPKGIPKSKGHVGFTDKYEYFFTEKGDLYRAPTKNSLDVNGIRQGVRFESTKAGAEAVLEQVRLKKPTPPTETVSFMGSQQAYEQAVKSIKWLRDASKSFGEGMADALDVEAPWKRVNAPETGFQAKNIFSQRAMHEEFGLRRARENAKMFNFDKKLAPEVVLSAEDPAYFKSLPKETRSKIKEATTHLEKYFKDSKAEYKKLGVDIDFKKRITQEIENLMAVAETSEIPALKEALAIARRMNFIHIPSTMWFEQYIGKDPVAGMKILKLLATQKRKSLTIKSLIDRELINKVDVHPADIIANYSRRKGRDFALLNLVNAAIREGLASKTPKPGLTAQVPAYKAPILAKYHLHPTLADFIYDITASEKSGIFHRIIVSTKMMQFYNPLFLPMYDVVQGTMLGSMRSLKTPKYIRQGITDIWKKTPEYWKALDNGLASKPFNNPWTSFQKSLEAAKKTPMGVVLNQLSPNVIKTIYNLSWYTAWQLDKALRMVSYRYLLDKGYSPRKAAQTAAKFHADYASVPVEMRRTLNTIFFTPTFKITMGKLWGNMIKGAAQSTVKLGKVDKTTSLYGKAAIATLGINFAMDGLMRYLGFETNEFGRRYIKRGIETEEGEKDLVVTWSSPANMWTKYLSRAITAAQTDKQTEGVKSFIEMNRWEFAPIYRTMYDMFWLNQSGSGATIVDPFDSDATKAIKRTKHFVKSIVRVIGLADKDVMDKTARDAFTKETNKALELITRPFVFKYMRSPKERRAAYRIRSLYNQFIKSIFQKAFKGEEMETEQIDIFNEKLDEVLSDLEQQ